MTHARTASRFDLWLLGSVLALVSVGVVMVYSASAVLAMDRFGDPAYFLKRQVLYAAAGLAVLVGFSRMDYRLWRKAAYPLLGLSLLSLAAVLMPGVGAEVGGARRWFHLGGVSVQPVEGAKFSLIVFLAYFLAVKGERIRDFRFGFFPAIGLAAALVVPVALQPDAGSAVLLMGVAFLLLFLAGARPLHLGASAAAGLPLLVAFLLSAGYRRRRLLTFLDPWADPEGSGFQMVQSYLSLAQGGWAGEGLMQGKAKLHFLPAPHTDFIFAVLGEELGLLGAGLILAVFGLFLWRISRAATRCQDPFGAYLAAGFAALLGLQTLGNLGVVSGLLPTKGLPLPFFSAGGSALIASMAAVGVLLSVAATQRLGRDRGP
ncbi:MAG: putative lipid II flippase FtsW [Candidatus Tectomicrobia bacterium]|nr:putative lipid II flippase FtsW [Candidatus Tectomicrobia bacterium]